jgi:hypothetical protein
MAYFVCIMFELRSIGLTLLKVYGYHPQKSNMYKKIRRISGWIVKLLAMFFAVDAEMKRF